MSGQCLNQFRNLGLLTYIALAIGYLASLTPLAYSDNINSNLFSIDSSPYGVNNSDWSIKWWKWFMQIPQDQNPSTDNTGVRCSVNQKETNVWFIIGVLEGSAERTCKIPLGKAIFFAHGIECSRIENKLNTDQELEKCAADGLPTLVESIQASIDGKPLKDVLHYKVVSQPFDVSFPQNNVWGVSAGKTRSAADTYIIFLKPLFEGTHLFEFRALSPIDKHSPNPPQALEVKYHLIVEK
jgi:hypothetical protein